jgi:hypothetical protein
MSMKNLLLLLFVSTLILSCQKKQEAQEETTTEVSPSFEAERSAFFNNLMKPTEVAASLQATAADFNASLMNDPKNYASYANDPVKAAANLGVYLSDLNYSVAYKQSANTKELFGAAHELSKAIGGEQGVLEYLMKRYSENIDKNDSVEAVMDELFDKSVTSLQGTEREKMAGITMSAYQIENLHIALGIIESYPKDMLPTDVRTQILIPVFRAVLDQKENVENIYGFLRSVTDPMQPDQNPNYPYYATAFEELIAVYNKLDVEDKIANNQGIELMNDAVVKELSEKVNAIRNKIVSVQ